MAADEALENRPAVGRLVLPISGTIILRAA